MELVDARGLVSGYEIHVPNLKLPDSDDRHVLAAAIQSSASHIVTYNLSDFPSAALADHNVEATHPDIFLSALFDEKREQFLIAMRTHRLALKSPPKSPEDYIETLLANRLTRLAARIEYHSLEV